MQTSQSTKYRSTVIKEVKNVDHFSYNVRKRTFLRTLNDDSNQPAHPHSLVRVFVIRVKTLCNLGYTKCAQPELSLRWAHMIESTFSNVTDPLTLTTLWADSADDKLVIFFLFFLQNRIRHFWGDNLHEMSDLIFYTKIFQNFLPSMQSVNLQLQQITFLIFYFSDNVRLDMSYGSSARCQAIFLWCLVLSQLAIYLNI